MEAEEQLEAQEEIESGNPVQSVFAADAEGKLEVTAEEEPKSGIFPASDWEAIVEAVLFTMGNSVELRQLAIAIDQSEKVAKRVVEKLKKRYRQENRGMQIIELEDAYQMSTRAEYYENLIRVAATPKKQVLTDVVLETLSIIAYRQPVTKMEISKIRGVSSDHAVNRLVEYGLVYEAGRLDAPGRPALFATTEEFLRRFGVSSMVDLPTMNPEQEAEIRQEVQEELQLKLNEQGETEEAGETEDCAAEKEAVETADRAAEKEAGETEQTEHENRDEEIVIHATDQD
ncbi:MAG: SMC-Scp complex subunit ScpB [Eubacteriales bacterium]|nr:SMC-Scp complex subunit ScpB [Eubacteriales bacterium]